MFAEKLAQIKKNIAEAQVESPYKGEVTIVGVTKNQPVSAANEIIENGISIIAENRVQAMKEKAELLLPSKRHLIGHLQTNKARVALSLCDVIQSVDSERLLLDLNRISAETGKVAEIFFQVNIAREEIKFGLFKEELAGIMKTASSLENIKVSGLMAIMPIETKLDYYKDMYDVYTEAKQTSYPNIDLKYLSMGMSNDYEAAVSCGANMVRLGRCLFN